MDIHTIKGKTISDVVDEWEDDNDGSVIKIKFTDGTLIRIGAINSQSHNERIWYENEE